MTPGPAYRAVGGRCAAAIYAATGAKLGTRKALFTLLNKFALMILPKFYEIMAILDLLIL